MTWEYVYNIIGITLTKKDYLDFLIKLKIISLKESGEYISNYEDNHTLKEAEKDDSNNNEEDKKELLEENHELILEETVRFMKPLFNISIDGKTHLDLFSSSTEVIKERMIDDEATPALLDLKIVSPSFEHSYEFFMNRQHDLFNTANEAKKQGDAFQGPPEVYLGICYSIFKLNDHTTKNLIEVENFPSSIVLASELSQLLGKEVKSEEIKFYSISNDCGCCS